MQEPDPTQEVPDVARFDRAINRLVERSFEDIPNETKAKVLELYVLQLREENTENNE